MSYDRHQFEHIRKRGSFAKDANEAGVAGNEFRDMHTITAVGRTRRYIPEFAFDDGQLRSVIIHATLGYIYRVGKVPADVETDLAYLKKLAADRQAWVEACAQGSLSAHWQACEEHITAVANCGGYMEMLGAVAYRAWRLRWHDRDIAASLAMTVSSVADVRTRLLRYAERLGFPTFPPRKGNTRIDDALVASMWSNRATVNLIAVVLGCSGRVVRHSLRKQGLYVRRPGNRPRPGIDLEKRRTWWRSYRRKRRSR